MNAENRMNACAAQRDELLRLAYEDVALAAASADLRAHLAGCPACRETWREAREWLDVLTPALTPEPLPTPLERRIQTRLADVRIEKMPEKTLVRTIRPWAFPRWLRALGTVAAACLLATAFAASGRLEERSASGAGAFSRSVLSRADAVELLFAWGLLRWTGSLDESVGQLADWVQDLESTVEQDSDAARSLPWAPSDDWDAPPPDGEGASFRAPRSRVTCS